MDAIDPRAALDALVADSGESYAALSRMLRRNDAYLQQYVKRGTPRVLAERDRKLLAAYFNVDEAVLGGASSSPNPAMISVRRLDVAASAGPGGLVEDDKAIGDARFDRNLLDMLGIRTGKLAMIRAEGDSMNPLIEDGDQMLVDEGDRRTGPRGAIYVIRLDQALMVKRVSRNGDRMTIASDNPAFPVMPEHGVSDVDIIGRVVWLSRSL
ncbi:MAG: S24 family peptidase [Pseudomonadota bacterium]|uniref:S24 family peptidase n=1 Tax=Sphingomonas sp. ERG5 TaxID=1381597 RepID=UPI00054BF205|nr:S24 family peptidase [Sphingomonas sp. ERG5]